MNKFKSFGCLILILEVILTLFCNGLYIAGQGGNGGRIYRVEAKRAAREIEKRNPTQEELEAMDLSAYSQIVRIRKFSAENDCSNDYVVEEINGGLYQIEYQNTWNYNVLFYINGILIGMILLTSMVFLYVYKKVLKPFEAMGNLTYELAKGNLSVPVKEEKSKVFGKFLWGMDMLRERLEDNKEKELEFQRERKTLLLSLSHDIKTPLASIELYSRALSEGLYDTENKKHKALLGIMKNVKEIKRYVDEIVTASREDFLHLEVVQEEFYLSEILEATEIYYTDKLSVIHTELKAEKFEECLIKGDKNRLIEVLQNILENAVKYGDGTYIKIYCTDEEDCKLIRIENSGCNLKEEELPNLFDSFYRGSNSRGIKGNGLGLYICKSLMQKMDGEIYAQVEKDQFCVTVVVRRA